jgi:hypothetical protein
MQYIPACLVLKHSGTTSQTDISTCVHITVETRTSTIILIGHEDMVHELINISPIRYSKSHGRTGRKKLGGRKEICSTSSDCARVVKKIFRRNFPKLLSTGEGDE